MLRLQACATIPSISEKFVAILNMPCGWIIRQVKGHCSLFYWNAAPAGYLQKPLMLILAVNVLHFIIFSLSLPLYLSPYTTVKIYDLDQVTFPSGSPNRKTCLSSISGRSWAWQEEPVQMSRKVVKAFGVPSSKRKSEESKQCEWNPNDALQKSNRRTKWRPPQGGQKGAGFRKLSLTALLSQRALGSPR